MKISLQRRNALMVADGAFSHKIHTEYNFLGDSKSRRASKFKSYDDFSEWSDSAFWRSFIGKGLCLQPAQQACLYENLKLCQFLHVL